MLIFRELASRLTPQHVISAAVGLSIKAEKTKRVFCGLSDVTRRKHSERGHVLKLHFCLVTFADFLFRAPNFELNLCTQA